MAVVIESAENKRDVGLIERHNSKRFYVVTFDIENSKGKNALYEKVRSAIENAVGPGNYHKLLKQCCFLQTDIKASNVRQIVRSVLGRECNILAGRLQPGAAWKMSGIKQQLAAKRFFEQLREAEG